MIKINSLRSIFLYFFVFILRVSKRSSWGTLHTAGLWKKGQEKRRSSHFGGRVRMFICRIMLTYVSVSLECWATNTHPTIRSQRLLYRNFQRNTTPEVYMGKADRRSTLRQRQHHFTASICYVQIVTLDRCQFSRTCFIPQREDYSKNRIV